MPKMVRYKDTFYAGGVPKYEQGKDYDLSDETKSHVVAGYAAIVNIKGGKLIDEPVADPVDPIKPELPLLDSEADSGNELTLKEVADDNTADGKAE